MDEAIALMQRLAADRFFGSLVMKFESGKVVLFKKEETIKPLENCRDNRGNLIERNT
jgi:hypothetical protein